jgi:hypothetical protein
VTPDISYTFSGLLPYTAPGGAIGLALGLVFALLFNMLWDRLYQFIVRKVKEHRGKKGDTPSMDEIPRD